MEEENRIKEELRLLHLLKRHLEVGLQDKVKANMLLEHYKKNVNNNETEKEGITRFINILEEALNDKKKGEISLTQIKEEINKKRRELAMAKINKRKGR